MKMTTDDADRIPHLWSTQTMGLLFICGIHVVRGNSPPLTQIVTFRVRLKVDPRHPPRFVQPQQSSIMFGEFAHPANSPNTLLHDIQTTKFHEEPHIDETQCNIAIYGVEHLDRRTLLALRAVADQNQCQLCQVREDKPDDNGDGLPSPSLN